MCTMFKGGDPTDSPKSFVSHGSLPSPTSIFCWKIALLKMANSDFGRIQKNAFLVDSPRRVYTYWVLPEFDVERDWDTIWIFSNHGDNSNSYPISNPKTADG